MVIKRAFFILTAFFFLAALHGCGPSLREQALIDFENQIRTFKTVGIIPPDTLVYEMGSGGMRELMDEWSLTARQNFAAAFKQELQARYIDTRAIKPDRETEGELEDIVYLFRAISDSLEWHTTYRKLSLCDDVKVCRDYSVGPVEHLFRRYGVDAFLVVFASNEIETGGRKGVRRASRVMSIFTPFYAVRNPGTFVSLALIDRTGTVLWYVGIGTGKGYDLRDQQRVDEIVKRILNKLFGEAAG